MAKTKKLFDYNAPFPTRFRSLFDEKGVTRDVLAVKFNTTRQTISNWMNGDTIPDAVSICEIARYFGVTTDYLLGLTDVRTVETDVRAVAEYTGLSEDAVDTLNRRLDFINKSSKEFLENEDWYLETEHYRNERIIMSKMISDGTFFSLCEELRVAFETFQVLKKQEKMLTSKEDALEIIAHRNDDEYSKQIMLIFGYDKDFTGEEITFVIDSKNHSPINIDCSKIQQSYFDSYKTSEKYVSDSDLIRQLFATEKRFKEDLAYRNYCCGRIVNEFSDRLNNGISSNFSYASGQIVRDIEEGESNGTNKEAD